MVMVYKTSERRKVNAKKASKHFVSFGLRRNPRTILSLCPCSEAIPSPAADRLFVRALVTLLYIFKRIRIPGLSVNEDVEIACHNGQFGFRSYCKTT